jgi:hypothetical protein
MADSHNETIAFSSQLLTLVLSNPLQVIRLRNVYLELRV